MGLILEIIWQMKEHFLAWIRTSIGIMAFGFVVEKFSLFMKQIESFAGKISLPYRLKYILLQGYSSIFGVFLVAIGASHMRACLFQIQIR